jgi:hypothetical protein
MEHYRCYKVYVSRTRAIRVSDQVHFQHKYITNPAISPESHVVAAAQQLTIALKGNIPAGNKTLNGLKKLSKIFNKIATAKAEVAALQSQQAINCRTIRLYPDIETTRIEPQIEIAAPRVSQTTPKENAAVPRVQITTNKVTAAAPRGPTPSYISQDKD